jgi:hypothetical protein
MVSKTSFTSKSDNGDRGGPSNTDTNAHTDSNSNSDTYSNTDSNADSNTYANTFTNTDTEPWRCRSHLQADSFFFWKSKHQYRLNPARW